MGTGGDVKTLLFVFFLFFLFSSFSPVKKKCLQGNRALHGRSPEECKLQDQLKSPRGHGGEGREVEMQLSRGQGEEKSLP